MNADFPSRYSARILFELPSSWQNYAACEYHNSLYAHAWLLLHSRASGLSYICELTKCGVTVERVFPHEWNLVEDERLMDTVTSFGFDLTDDEYFSCLIRMEALKQLPIRWSDWNVFPYLFGGSFASMTCCSFVSYILWGQFIDLPEDLVEACRYDWNKEEFNVHPYDGY
jgi:hypothetical protein